MPKTRNLTPLIIDENDLFALPEPREITSSYEKIEKAICPCPKSRSRDFNLKSRKSLSNADIRERISGKIAFSSPRELSKWSLTPTPQPENGKDFDFETTHITVQGERTGRKITLSSPRESKYTSISPTSRPENVEETNFETTDAIEKEVRIRSKSRGLGRARSSNSNGREEQHVRFSLFEESSSDSLTLVATERDLTERSLGSDNSTITVFSFDSIKDQSDDIDCLALRGANFRRLGSKSRIRTESISRQSSESRIGRSSELSTPRYLSGRSVAPTPRPIRNLVETPRSEERCDPLHVP